MRTGQRSNAGHEVGRILNSVIRTNGPCHDTQPGQALEAPIEGFFKPLAYALILLRAEG